MPTNVTQTLERLQDLARGLNASRPVDSYLRDVLAAAKELTGSERASILDYEAESGKLRIRLTPEGLGAGASRMADGSLAGQAARSGSAVKGREGDPLHPVLAAPLKYHDKVVGVLEVLDKTNGTDYTEDDATILEMLAGLACGAIENDLLERRVKKSLDEVAELDRLKSDFIAITSHELRTPLGLILGHATFLREMLESPYSEQVEAIIRNASKLKEIVESLSSVDNFRNGAARVRDREISVKRIIEEVTASFEPMARQQGVELRTEVGADELLVEGDATKIAIALSNLVKNALTFTDPGGHVLVTGEPVTGFAKVSVIDDGVGIPASDLARIFERFYQVESHLTRRHSGMGLGLSVAKAMIEMHGGRIWVDSEEGKGSTFTLLLPFERRSRTGGAKSTGPFVGDS